MGALVKRVVGVFCLKSTEEELDLTTRRTAAPFWYVRDSSNGRRVIDGVSLAEATAFVRLYRDRDLVVQRSALWVEPSPPPRRAA